MPDNLKQRGGQDRKRIDVTQEHELRDWSKKFGVSQDQLKDAVRAVGDRAEAVEKHLRTSPSVRKPAKRAEGR
jgi:hypothetical protein